MIGHGVLLRSRSNGKNQLRRLLSNNSSSGAYRGNEKKSGSAIYYIFLTAGTLCTFSAYLSYRMENEPDLRPWVQMYTPNALEFVIDPLREMMLNAGIMKSYKDIVDIIEENGNNNSDDNSDDNSDNNKVEEIVVETEKDNENNDNDKDTAEVTTLVVEVEEKEIEVPSAPVISTHTSEKPKVTLIDSADSKDDKEKIYVMGEDKSLLTETIRDLIRTQGNKNVQDYMLDDLNGLSKEQLISRAQALVTQLIQSAENEASLTSEELLRTEKELEASYLALLQQQRAELALAVREGASVLEQRLRDEGLEERNKLIASLENSNAKALREQFVEFDKQWMRDAEGEQAQLVKEMNQQKNEQMKIQDQIGNTLITEMKSQLDSIKSNVATAQGLVEDEMGREKASAYTRKAAGAAMTLQKAVESGTALGPAVEVLNNVTSDILTSAVIDALPSLALEQGVPGIEALRLRFKVVHREVHRAACAPQSTIWNPVPLILKSAVGEFIHAITYKDKLVRPNLLHRGNSDVDVLARVAYRLDQGNLEEALKEVQRLKGLPRVLIRDWEEVLQVAVASQQAAKVINTRSALQNLLYV